MKRILFIVLAGVLLCAAGMAENHDLLWDYTERGPGSCAAEHLWYLTKSTDAAGVNNGLKGIKLDSKGYCYFTKAPVAGRLKLYFGDRTTNKATSLLVYTWEGDTPCAQTLIAETGELTEYGMQVVELTAEQNNIYITRGGQQVETVLQKIQFKEGFDATPEPCAVVFKDQNGKELGRTESMEGALLETIPFAEKDLPESGEGMRFRGWYYTNGKKARVGDVILSNTTIQAKVTPIQRATVGSVQVYELSAPNFYAEDQDLLDMTSHDVTLQLAGAKAVVVLESADGSEAVKEYSGKKIVTIPTKEPLAKITVYNVPVLLRPDAKGAYHVRGGDAASFLLALRQANKSGNATIYLKNGVYDLGELTLTPISGHNITIIGESMEKTIIRNAPHYSIESINRTATLRIMNDVRDTYLQDLTIQNAMDYYHGGGGGRAVCLWDQGTQTICKRVRLLSYQDTYYSNKQGAVKLFEDCEIHGTVDYICGDGSVYFKNTLLYCEKRNVANTGVDYITASNSGENDRGYVFEGCTIKSECPNVSFGRAWRYSPKCVFLNTVVQSNASWSLIDGHWTPQLMNRDAWPSFGEYNTRTEDGTLLTPKTNDVTFIDTNSGNTTRTLPTILTAGQAAEYTMDFVLGAWAQEARQKISFNQFYKQ